MFLLRVTFWVFVIGFLFSGGQLPTDGPAAERSAQSPTEETAARVMQAAGELGHFCEDRPAMCRVGAEAGRLGIDLAAYASGRLHGALVAAGSEPTQDAAPEAPSP
ncbi:MAG: hypothetical protein AAGF19_10170 [Pseudomonadota bacterium]